MRRLYFMAGLALVLLLSGLAMGLPLLFKLFYGVVFALALSLGWGVLALWRLEVRAERSHGRLQVGEEIETTVTLSNPTLLPRPLLTVSDLTEIPGCTVTRVMNVPIFTMARWRTRARLRRRGVYPLGHLTVASTDPLGIFTRRRVVPSAEEVVIYPAIRPLPWFFLPMKGLLKEGSTSLSTSPEVTPLVGTVREYVQGDTFRHIHWPSTARKGRLMSKQFDAGVENRAWVILDLNRAVQAGDEVENTEEMAVEVAASVVHRLLRDGWVVGLAGQGDRLYLVPSHEGTPADRYLEVLAQVRAEGTVPLEEFLASAHGFLPPPPYLLVVVTPDASAGWLRPLGALNSRGVLVSLVLVDAGSFGAVAPGAVPDFSGYPGLIAYTVRRGDDITQALDYRRTGASVSALVR